jgi:HSP20 family protein
MPLTKKENGREFFRPAYPLGRVGDEFEALFNRFFAGWPVPSTRGFYPEGYYGVDTEETAKEYIFCVEAPGFEATDFDVNIVGELLTVKAVHKVITGEKKTEAHAFAGRHFERCMTLPAGVLSEKIEVLYKNGILEIHVPKSEEAKPRRVIVKT